MLYNYLVLPNNIIFMTICLENCNKYVAGIKVNAHSLLNNIQNKRSTATGLLNTELTVHKRKPSSDPDCGPTGHKSDTERKHST